MAAPAASPRPMHGANMLLEVKRWVASTFPYWNRTNGADHIWLLPHDEGACWAPTEVYNNSIILTHWGRWVGACCKMDRLPGDGIFASEEEEGGLGGGRGVGGGGQGGRGSVLRVEIEVLVAVVAPIFP